MTRAHTQLWHAGFTARDCLTKVLLGSSHLQAVTHGRSTTATQGEFVASETPTVGRFNSQSLDFIVSAWNFYMLAALELGIDLLWKDRAPISKRVLSLVPDISGLLWSIRRKIQN